MRPTSRRGTSCAPGTIETVRKRFEEDDGFVRIDRRRALLREQARPSPRRSRRGRSPVRREGAAARKDLTHFRESLPLFADIFPRPTRDTFVSIPNDGFYGQVWRFWEHTGTHLDVPAHFIVGGRTTPELSLDELMSPLAVIDISSRAASNPDTVVTVGDLRAYRRGHGRIKRGSIVAMDSGWDARAGARPPSQRGRRGTSHFPGFSGDAVEWLIDRRRSRVSVSTRSASTPAMPPYLRAHLTLLGANRFGIENLANLSRIPAKGATAFVGVIPWEEGSGGPARRDRDLVTRQPSADVGSTAAPRSRTSKWRCGPVVFLVEPTMPTCSPWARAGRAPRPRARGARASCGRPSRRRS